MKTRSLYLSALCAMALTAGFTSCSSDDDDDPWDPSKEGSKVEMAETRAFVLNEGAYQKNNAGLMYFDWKTDTGYASDLFLAQNDVQMGDVGQDILVDDKDNLYVILSGSKVIYKLNSVGVVEKSIHVDDLLGDPRYGVLQNGSLFVTCYGGFVAKYDASTLSLLGTVEVGPNPEYIIEEGGKLYCTCSGWGADKRVACIDIKSFKEATYFDVMDNPDRIIATEGHIFVQGYGADYSYPWGELNVTTGEFTQMGNASSWTAYKGMVYLCNSVTDWSTYATTNYFYTYNAKTGSKTEESFLKGAPEELGSTSVYGISVNEKTGHLYIMTTDFVSNGAIYHFDQNMQYVGKIASTGVNPRKVVFLD